MEIFPSLISSDILNLEKTIKLLDPHCHGYHIDVMDDHFVPNLTWGSCFVNAISKVTDLPLHVHLMVDDPIKWIDRLDLNPSNIFIFHIEPFLSSLQECRNFIKDLKVKNCRVGIAINPDTKVENIFDFLNDLDHVLIMSVKPGFSGQKFMIEVLNKVEPLLEKRRDEDLSFSLGMDGGIDKSNIARLADIGVEQVGIASAIFDQKDWIKSLGELYNV
ncbi:ribulose-phosphate 3-epimerase [Candidatus Babeliales bacterium]|nr:ribulose-phosphate 3-epimerase [Candidatus Babeliales bacterium]